MNKHNKDEEIDTNKFCPLYMYQIDEQESLFEEDGLEDESSSLSSDSVKEDDEIFH